MYIYNTQKNYNPLSHFRGLTKKNPRFYKKNVVIQNCQNQITKLKKKLK